MIYLGTVSGAANGYFTNIPQNFKNLQIRVYGRDSLGATTHLYLRLNNDAGSNYWMHSLAGINGTLSDSSNGSLISYFPAIWLPTNSNTSNLYGTGIVDILNYSNTSMFKTMGAYGGFDLNASATGRVGFHDCIWNSTAAVTSIEIGVENGGALAGNRYDLYAYGSASETGA